MEHKKNKGCGDSMVSVFKKEVLNFLTTIHQADACQGLMEFQRKYQDTLPDVRTLYRWLTELGDDLIYFPVMNSRTLGLVPFHLILSNPDEHCTTFPLAVECAWVIKEWTKRDLYLFGYVPAQYKEEFLSVLGDVLSSHCKEHICVFSDDGQQQVADVSMRLDHDGRILPGTDSLEQSSLKDWHNGVVDELRECPFMIPVLFEGYGARQSLPGLWKTIASRLGDKVWDYLPSIRKKYHVNGKTYVTKAYEFLNSKGIFRQNILKYKPWLVDAVEVFLVVEGKSEEEIHLFVHEMGRVCPVMQVYPSREPRLLLRMTGDCSMLYRLMDAFTDKDFVQLYFMDKKRTWDDKSKARFIYEELFNPEAATWVSPEELLLRWGKNEYG